MRIRRKALKTILGEYAGDGSVSLEIIAKCRKIVELEIVTKRTVHDAAVSIFKSNTDTVNNHVDGGAIASVPGNPEHRFVTNAIISIVGNKFKIDDDGTDEHPNKLGQDYQYRILGY